MNDKIKKIMLYTGIFGSVISAIAYLIITYVIVIGFASAVDQQKQILFAILGSSIGLIITFLLRTQGISFAEKEPESIKNIITRLVKYIKVPITVKIRLGWDQANLNYKKLSRIIEGSGAAMIAVHARARNQNWQESASWYSIREIKETVQIPVIGNGDIQSLKDIKNMIKQTGCDGVMIGRAAIGNPWIFSETSKTSLSAKQIIDVVKTHWLLMIAFYGPKKTSSFFKKHLKAYLSCPQFSHIDLKKLISMPNPMRSRLFFE